jgi:hypothetical protein
MKMYKKRARLTILVLIAVMGFLPITASADLDPQVGESYMFWWSDQGFFSTYFQSSATLNAIGNNCYVFTEDARIRELAIAPWDQNTVAATTNSGVFVSSNAGATWTAMSGSDGDVLPFEPVSGLVNVSAPADQHVHAIYSIAFEDSSTWWAGIEGGGTDDGGSSGQKTVFRSTDVAETWKKKATGMPTFDGESSTVYDIHIIPGTDEPFSAGKGGLFWKSGFSFSQLNQGFPAPATTDWPGIPAYAVTIYDSTVMVVATDVGLFGGNAEAEYEDKLPIEGGTVTVNSSFLSYVTVDILDSTQTDSFTLDWSTGDTVWFYDYSTVSDTTSWHLTLGLDTVSSAGVSMSVGQTLNIYDAADTVMWTGEAAYNSDLGAYTVDLMNENVYYFNENNFDDDDDDSTTYSADYDISGVTVHSTGTEAVSALAIDSTGTVYYSTASGVFSVSVEEGGNPSDFDLDDVEIYSLALSADEGTLFAGTSEGVQSTSLSGDPSWTEVTPKIYTLNTGDSLSYVVTALAVADDGTIYAGSGTPPMEDRRIVKYRPGGVLKSTDDGATWAPMNVGLTHRSSNTDDVAAIIATMDSSIAADSTMGLFDFMTGRFGDTPDIDGDDKIVVLVADMGDYAYGTLGDLVVEGLFDPIDQAAPDVQPYSNYLDVIYVDSDPHDPATAQEGMAQAMTGLIQYNYDTDEDDWVTTGLQHFGAYVAGYKSVDGGFSLVNGNSLMMGDEGLSAEYGQLFTLMEYLYEHYFGEGASVQMSAVLQDTANGTDGLDNSLIAVGASGFDDVFVDYSIAVHFDDSTGLNEGLYGFENVDVSVSTSTYPWGTTSGTSPYPGNFNSWSATYLQSEKWVEGGSGWSDKAPAFNAETLIFNGSDASDISLAVIKQLNKSTHDTSASVAFATLDDDHNRAIYTDWADFGGDSLYAGTDSAMAIQDSSDLTNPYQYFAMVAVCRDAGSSAGGAYIVDDETTVPSLFSMQVAQNPDLINYLDIYSFSDVQIYSDGAFGNLNNDTDEGPHIDVKDDTSTVASFTVPRYYSPDGGYVYRQSFDLASLLPTTVSEFWFVGYAESIGGNQAGSDSILVAAVKGSASSSRLLASDFGGFSFLVPAGAVEEDAIITVISDSRETALGGGMIAVDNALVIGPAGVEIEESFRLSIDLADVDFTGMDAVKLDIVAVDGENVTSLEATVDLDQMTVSAEIPATGTYRFVWNPSKAGSAGIPETYALHQNYPNPFNPTTNIRFDMPETGFASLRIYDVLGREVVTLMHEEIPAGKHAYSWNGKDMYGRMSATGIYFYRLKTAGYTKTRKMLLVK